MRVEAVADGAWRDPQLEVVIDRELTGAKPALPPVSSASRAAPSIASAVAPKRSSRPPNATTTTAHQAQPSARPQTVSVSQWTPSITRLTATATAMPTAAPAQHARPETEPRRASTNAIAA